MWDIWTPVIIASFVCGLLIGILLGMLIEDWRMSGR